MSAIPRPSLPTSSSDFALSPSTSASALSPTSPAGSADDLTPFMLRFRRPALHSPRGYFSESRLHSPLAASFTLQRRHSISGNGEESESDRDKMSTDSDSGSGTPLLSGPLVDSGSDATMKTSRPRTPSTPPRSVQGLPPPEGSENADAPQDTPFRSHSRRPSHILKAPAVLRLISESHHPEESDVQSEAQFQRLVASVSALPITPRTPRGASDRGRYPEEAEVDEPTREDTPSDDGELDEAIGFTYIDSISAMKPVTPAQSINGDDLSMLDSPLGGPVAMDVDMPPISGSPIMSSWRHTPPPTSSAVRSNKRKSDDRYDPYPTAAKRRAVSPSVSYLREQQYSILNGRAGNGMPRLSMPIPIPIPVQPNGLASGTSSPIVSSSNSYFTTGLSHSRSASALSSPTMRSHMGLASPVLRPIIRSRRLGSGDGEREVDGAGHAVNEMSLNDPRSPTLL